MSTARARTAPARRSFTWSIRSTDIRFVPPNQGAGAIDGTATCKCSDVAVPQRPRRKRAAKGTGARA